MSFVLPRGGARPSVSVLVVNSLEIFVFVSSEEDDEDFSRGIGAFLRAAQQRRLIRSQRKGPLSLDDVSVEHRILAAATFEKTFVYDKLYSC